jgi:transcriptional regulator with XRE-family HTH domain
MTTTWVCKPDRKQMERLPESREKLLTLIGMRLRRAREKRDPETGKKLGMSRARAAELLGAGEASIQKWEDGKVAASCDMIARASELYGVSTDFILGRDPRVEGKSLVDVQVMADVERAIETGDEDFARRCMNYDPPILLLGVVVPEGAELRPATQADRDITDLQRRFCEAFPKLAKHWAKRHGRTS